MEGLLRFKAKGGRPVLSEDGRVRLRSKSKGSIAAARNWQRTHAWPEVGAFEREILPLLATIELDRLMVTTGLSRPYCVRITQGLVKPHPMWWEAIKAAADAASSSS